MIEEINNTSQKLSKTGKPDDPVSSSSSSHPKKNIMQHRG